MTEDNEYNYRNCQSLFGYSAKVHLRSNGKCQLCDCGGIPLDFDLWRQMTVEHLIGKSQGGYLNQIKEVVKKKFPDYSENEINSLADDIDKLNTVTACQFCNSTTSRDKSEVRMGDIIMNSGSSANEILLNVKQICGKILDKKRENVSWKLRSVEKAFKNEILPEMGSKP